MSVTDESQPSSTPLDLLIASVRGRDAAAELMSLPDDICTKLNIEFYSEIERVATVTGFASGPPPGWQETELCREMAG